MCAVVQHRGDLEGESAPIRAHALDSALPAPRRSPIDSLALSSPAAGQAPQASPMRVLNGRWGSAGGMHAAAAISAGYSKAKTLAKKLTTASLAAGTSPATCRRWAPMGAAFLHACVRCQVAWTCNMSDRHAVSLRSVGRLKKAGH